VFEGKLPLIETTAFATAASKGLISSSPRALGLDCGPMSEFDNAGVNREFFADTQVKWNFLCNIGYGDHSKLFARSPRHDFPSVCTVL
jgi:3-hydroxypropanoate dehydrogenase